MDPSTIFAWIIAVLAGLACIGALAVVVVREWYALQDTIRRHRRPTRPAHEARYWLEHTAVGVPERRP